MSTTAAASIEVVGILGYVGALLTGLYTFRMIFRAFFGDPSPEAVELEHGHLAHAEVPRNPMTGEVEDNDVGFPGPEHVIAEREPAMKVAMGVLAVLAVVGGADPGPGRRSTSSATSWRRRSSNAPLASPADEPSNRQDWIGLVIGAVIGLVGISLAYSIYVARPGTAARLQKAMPWLHNFLVHKWYFDEAIDLLVVRPGAGDRPLHRVGARADRDLRRGHRRCHRRGALGLRGGAPRPDRPPALLRGGSDARALGRRPLLPDLVDLISTVTLSILLWLPLALALIATQLPTRLIGRSTAVLSLIPLGDRDQLRRPLPFRADPGLQFVTDRVWISSLGIHYKLGINGLNVTLVLLTTVLFTLSLAWSAMREVDRPRSTTSTSGSRRARCSAPSSRRT